MEYSLYIYLLSLIVGILLAYYNFEMLFIITLLGIVLCLIILTKTSKKRNTYFLTILIIFISFLNYKNNDISELAVFEDKKVELTAQVIDTIKEDAYKVKVSKINDIEIKNENLKLNIIDASRKYNIKEELQISGIIRLPNENTNPYLFNYKNYLKSKHIFTIMTIKEKDITSVEKLKLNYFEYMRIRFKSYIESKLDRNLEEPTSALMKGIILGNTNYLDEDMKDSYRNLGIAHILAVSGLHINIISIFFIKLFEIFKFNKKSNYKITLLIIWIYTYLIKAPASILRAVLMQSMNTIAKVDNKLYSTIRNISAACIIMLSINPLYIFDLGFILSYMATISMNIISKFLVNRFIFKRNKLIDLLISTISIYLGVGIIECYYFNSIKLISILSNGLIVPIISVAMVLCVVLLFVPNCFVNIIFLLSWFINNLFKIQMFIIDIINKIPFKIITMPTPDCIFLLYYYMILYFLIRFVNTRKYRYLMLSIKYSSYNYKRRSLFIKAVSLSLAFICCVDLIYMVNKRKEAEIHFIDVGQGDAALIQAFGKNIMIDTGGTVFGTFKIGENITLPYLVKHGIQNIDALFISHFDNDHYEAIHDLVGNIGINKIYCSYQPNEEIKSYLKENDLEYKVIDSNYKMKLNDDFKIDIIWPKEGFAESFQDPNDLSMVMLFEIYNSKLLFTGDISKNVEDKLLDDSNITQINILKVAHHGSDTSSNKEFIEKTKPDYAIISVGRKNRFNHPSKEVIKRFENQEVNVLRTDILGRIKITISNKKIDISRFILDNNIDIRRNMFVDSIVIYGLYYCSLVLVLSITCSKEENSFGI